MFNIEKTTMRDQVPNKEEKALALSRVSSDSIQWLGLVEGIKNKIKFIEKTSEKGVAGVYAREERGSGRSKIINLE